MKIKKVPFDIYIPATEYRAAVKVETIEIEVYSDDFGNEMVTPESSILIDKTQARYMGLLAAADIRALRERIGISQDQLSDLLGCGKKSLSRWENGHEYPSQLVNTLLRLLEANMVTPEDLRSVRQPCLTNGDSSKSAPASPPITSSVRWKPTAPRCSSEPPAKSSAPPPVAAPTARY
jgi:DNA-binding transcriptional regulator YiaG